MTGWFDRPVVDDLLTQLRSIGVIAQDAVPGWWGGKPMYGGYGHGFLPRLTLWRVFALCDDHIGVWSAWTGVPAKRLRWVARSELRFVKRTRGYDRFALGTYGFWVTRENGASVATWLDPRC
jgi:hypothetical protein